MGGATEIEREGITFIYIGVIFISRRTQSAKRINKLDPDSRCGVM